MIEVRHEHVEGILVVEASGRLDSGTSPELLGIVEELLPAGTPLVALDCANISLVTSAGLRAFMTILKKAKGKGGELKLYGLNDQIREILDITGLVGMIGVAATREDAILSLKQTAR